MAIQYKEDTRHPLKAAFEIKVDTIGDYLDIIAFLKSNNANRTHYNGEEE